MYQHFVTLSTDDLPEGFIPFASLKIIIDHQQMRPDVPLYFSVDPDNKRGHFSDVCVDQEDEEGEMCHIAHFYNHYDYTKALKSLLENDDNLNYYRLMISGQNRHDNKINVELTFYLKDSFLLNLYETNTVPLIVYQLVNKEKKDKKQKGENAITVSACHSFPVNHDNLELTMTPYDYQKQNYQWMVSLEQRVEADNHIFETIARTDQSNHVYYHIKSIDQYLLLDTDEKQMIDTSTLPTKQFKFYGGVLADDVGLGKTFSTICLIKARYHPEHNPTLILCPKRLCQQWDDEIKRASSLKTHIIYNITQFKKLTEDNINNYDIVLMSYEFLNNKRYSAYYSGENPLTHVTVDYQWERMVLDEGHEYLTNNKSMRKAPYRTTLQHLYRLKSKYKWICSGTPCQTNLDFCEVVRFLSNNELEAIEETNHGISHNDAIWDTPPQDQTARYDGHLQICHVNHKFLQQYYYCFDSTMKLLFRKNTKESVEHEVNIPPPQVETILLNMTSIERAIYNSALGDKEKMVEFCNHVQVSDTHLNILGNDPISLNEAHDKMVAYYEKKITYQNKRLENIANDVINLQSLEEIIGNDITTEEATARKDSMSILEDKRKEISVELKENLRKQAIFQELKENLEAEKSCPICYEELQDLYKAVTPCGHFICGECIQQISYTSHKLECPMCRTPFQKESLKIISPENMDMTMKLGTKMTALLKYLKETLEKDDGHRVIVFSQWDRMLRLISQHLTDHAIKYLILNGAYHTLNSKIRKFRLDRDIRVLLLSSEKAASGLNLTEANHIVLLDTLNNEPETSKMIESQAIGRAVRIGQQREVKVKRFIMANSIEEEFYQNYLSVA